MRILCTTEAIVRAAKLLALSVLLASAPVAAHANPKYAGIVVDAKTGKTLYSQNADAYRYPASLTKIMTTYIIFEELEAGRLSLKSRLKVSKNAAAEVPSKLGLKAGSTISVRDAIGALVTKSANDVATTVAENISGSEAAFARRMTRTARQLGMNKTTFRNAHGLPNSKQRTTARDMSKLGRAIQERFPEYYKFYNTRMYSYKGRKLYNHNKLLGRVKGVDGIKTGYIRASGFNLVTSVKRDGRHIVAVVMGGKTGARRNAHMTNLISRYLHKAKKGKRTAPLIASRTPVYSFEAASLKNPPKPVSKPGRSRQPAPATPMLLATPVPAPQAPVAQAPVEAAPVQQVATTAPASVPGFGADVPLPPRTVKRRLDDAFAVATALPPVPRQSPDLPVTTQSLTKTKLLAAARRAAGVIGLGTDRTQVAAASAGAPLALTDSSHRDAAVFKTVNVETIKIAAVQPDTVQGQTPIKTVETVKIEPNRQPVKETPVKTAAVAAPQEFGSTDDDGPETVTVATSDRPDIQPGWQIQIAAAETESQAVAMLKRAKTKTGSALRGKAPHTEPVDANGKTLYRARFIGFETKTAARKACKSLKRAKYACFAIYQ